MHKFFGKVKREKRKEPGAESEEHFALCTVLYTRRARRTSLSATFRNYYDEFFNSPHYSAQIKCLAEFIDVVC